VSSKKTYQVRGLTLYTEDHPKILQLQEEEGYPEIHGHKIWHSSYFIMDYLSAQPLPERASVMDIGCGWGLLGIYCARMFNARVTAVDADLHVFPFLSLHASVNDVEIHPHVSRFEAIPGKMLQGMDMIAGGDVCFWDELVDPLFVLIEKSVRHKVPLIIIADPGRSPFLRLARRCQKYFNTTLEPVSTDSPATEQGFLLIIRGPLTYDHL
jgi:predicted nicotinamide N-methyase